ncbi:MAG: acetylxylan esterase [Verrucomicrobia bacterium]|nr:acetylxylan esterase [Verrucomicrobiota bacterium]
MNRLKHTLALNRTSAPRSGLAGWAWGASVLAATACLGQEIILTPQKSNGVYEVGEKIQWRVELQGDSAASVTNLHYVLKKGGWTVMREGQINLAAGAGMLEAQLDEPGTILAEVGASLPARKIKALGGAVASPGKIRPSAPPPADFDAFWTAKIAELVAVPPHPVLEAAESDKASVEYYKIQIVTMVNSGHQDVKNSQARYYARYNAWNKALVQGETVPPRAIRYWPPVRPARSVRLSGVRCERRWRARGNG